MARYRYDGSPLGLSQALALERDPETQQVTKYVVPGEEFDMSVAEGDALVATGFGVTRVDGSKSEEPAERGSGKSQGADPKATTNPNPTA